MLSRRFGLLWLIQFLASVQFYLLTTIAAVYAMEQFGAGETAAGLTTSAFTVGAIIARLLTGKYMEIIGRKRVLVAGWVLVTLISAAYVLATGLTGLLLIRLINGASFGVVTTIAPAAVQAVIPHLRRGEATGIFFLVYAVTILVTRPFLGRLQDRRGDNAVLIPAFLFFAVGMVVLALTASAWMLLLVGVLLGCSFGAILTAAQTAAREERTADPRGTHDLRVLPVHGHRRHRLPAHPGSPGRAPGLPRRLTSTECPPRSPRGDREPPGSPSYTGDRRRVTYGER